jgi:hypothetical protein
MMSTSLDPHARVRALDDAEVTSYPCGGVAQSASGPVHGGTMTFTIPRADAAKFGIA